MHLKVKAVQLVLEDQVAEQVHYPQHHQQVQTPQVQHQTLVEVVEEEAVVALYVGLVEMVVQEL